MQRRIAVFPKPVRRARVLQMCAQKIRAPAMFVEIGPQSTSGGTMRMSFFFRSIFPSPVLTRREPLSIRTMLVYLFLPMMWKYPAAFPEKPACSIPKRGRISGEVLGGACISPPPSRRMSDFGTTSDGDVRYLPSLDSDQKTIESSSEYVQRYLCFPDIPFFNITYLFF